MAVYQEMTVEEVEGIIQEAHGAFVGWRRAGFADRAASMRRLARLLRDRQQELAMLMAREMGKPLASGRGEVAKCAWACDHYADNAEGMLHAEEVDTEATRSYVCFQPLGVILAIMPWNFPFWQVFRFAAPTLMAGNTVVMKHASNVPGCALAIEDAFHQAGFPEGVFRALIIGSHRTGPVIENPLVRGVTLTGSAEAGRAVAARAGQMVKKSVLELGGSDPYVVLDDGDLDMAAETCVASRLINCGQTCISAKRFIVTASQRGLFEDLVVERMLAARMGDPMEEATTLGPMARHDLRDDLHRQVTESIGMGARCLLGGQVPEGKGAFYPPTVLTDVVKGMPAYDEELFGPVAAIVTVQDEDEAIRVANDTAFGLGAAIFTRDVARGERIAAEEIEAGNCFVNSYVVSDPRLPFGGIKGSGYGRELSHFGIREFVNVKTVYVK